MTVSAQSRKSRTVLYAVAGLCVLAGLGILLSRSRLFDLLLPFAIEHASLDHEISEVGESKIHITITAVAASLIVFGVLLPNHRVRRGMLAATFSDPAFARLSSNRRSYLFFWVATLGGLILAALYAFCEGLGIADLYLEDQIFENISTAGFFLAALLLIQPVQRWRRFKTTTTWPAWRLVCAFHLLLIAGFVVVAGEEISWGQRVFGWETPQTVAEVNLQQETNLHNLYNEYFVQIYYGFALLIPFQLAAMRLPRRRKDPTAWSVALPHPTLTIMIGVNSAGLWRGELTEELLSLYAVLYGLRLFIGTRSTEWGGPHAVAG